MSKLNQQWPQFAIDFYKDFPGAASENIRRLGYQVESGQEFVAAVETAIVEHGLDETLPVFNAKGQTGTNSGFVQKSTGDKPGAGDYLNAASGVLGAIAGLFDNTSDTEENEQVVNQPAKPDTAKNKELTVFGFPWWVILLVIILVVFGGWLIKKSLTAKPAKNQ